MNLNNFKLCLSILIFIFLLNCASQIANLDSKGQNIICFGDSITSGEGVGIKDSYPSILSKLLKRKVINAGRPGDTTQTALKRLDSDVLSKDPYLVIIELGGNDFLQKVPLEKTLSNIEKIVKKIIEKGAIVVLCDISSGFLLSEYRKGYKKIARKYKAIFIPELLKGIIENPYLKSDFIHPNKEGHKKIAYRIYETLKEYNLFSK